MFLNVWSDGVVIMSAKGALELHQCKSLIQEIKAAAAAFVEKWNLAVDPLSISATCSQKNPIFPDLGVGLK